jgi:hypothetical protein
MGTASAEYSLFDQLCEPESRWRLAANQSPRHKARLRIPVRPSVHQQLVPPPRRREEDSERWDGLA